MKMWMKALTLGAAMIASPLAATLTATPVEARQAAANAQIIQVAMRWDHRREANTWTRSTMSAVSQTRLTRIIPHDIAQFCPGYAQGDRVQRAAFWTGLLSAIAKHESTWNPRAAGGGGRYLGLMQISRGTWGHYGCGGNIRDGSDNLACAVRIMASQVGRDGVVGAGGRGGVARDWGPMKMQGKRADIAAWTRRQAYCQN
ncbi:transglycosylase SLT domain-containing protein [Paracoccus sp. p4-l81]|uniref:transglycosylase SLT domain-containing protein n=1 Tax=unclassified Paracoccus (in: a-proteobacteria) TaxID=2688777 RepID=UPI0035B96367